ncbi:hypothetical protein K0M31_006846 [Melipona bicolor]|uniref:Uncharacterized protein n=1 Tax=Melipona bicolor TaxID=60889 RepID=A0AA40FSD8_9HYME|nr:hypothetical protein K0M31_006846 [Melipona bicolor]
MKKLIDEAKTIFIWCAIQSGSLNLVHAELKVLREAKRSHEMELNTNFMEANVKKTARQMKGR